MELNMLSLFSGIGAFEKALENIGIKINLKNFCEIDKYASQAYCAIHKVDKKLILFCQHVDKMLKKYYLLNSLTQASASSIVLNALGPSSKLHCKSKIEWSFKG